MNELKKFEKDFIIDQNIKFSTNYALLRLKPADGTMPKCMPGQFVQVEIPSSKTTYLRRPISINYADNNELWLLVRNAGAGTEALINTATGNTVNIILPLGHGFSTNVSGTVLLTGGGVGVAPLLYLGQQLKEKGVNVKFLLGARSAADLLELDEFNKVGEVFITTEDGSMGERGFVTQHSVWETTAIDHVACCGPMPMMKAVAAIATSKGIDCEVSLENRMACGLGACLCCVEDTADSGNVCVCKEGPVFNITKLKW